MGMFDSVFVKCPACWHGTMEFQSKAGECMLASYSLTDAPPAILGDIGGETKQCPNCKAEWRVNTIVHASLERLS